jgi:trigger factor
MNIELEDVDSCNKKIKLVIPQTVYKKKILNFYKKLAKDVKVPGFRKGKVPVSMLEKQYGPEVKREALNELINEYVGNAIKEKDLKSVSPPRLLEVEAEEGTDITVEASLEVLPEIEVKDYTGIEVELKIPKTTDEDVEKVIEAHQKRLAKNEQVTDRPSQDQDYLKIDFSGTLDGKPFDGGEANDYVIQVGTKQLVEGLENALIGMTVGEKKTSQVTIPESYTNKEIAGKTVDFDITLKGIQVKIMAEVNDDFAKEIDPNNKFDNVADMKAKIRQDLEEHAKNQGRRNSYTELAEKITDENSFDLPEGLIKDQIKFMVIQSQKQDNPGTAEPDQEAYEQMEVSAADEEKYREKSLKILQQELIMDKLAKELKVDISEEELNKEIQTLSALMGGGNLSKMKKDLAESGALSRLYTRMRREKTLGKILDQVKVKEEMVDRNTLIQDN